MVEQYNPIEDIGEDEVYISPSTYCLQRAGIEAYLTDEENFKPYVSSLNSKSGDNVKQADVSNENSDDSSSENEESQNEAPDTAYTLHQGEILETYYYTDLFSLNFESDYKEMTSSSSFTRSDVNLNQFYKGVRVKLLSEWEEPNETLEWTDLKEANLGFITEQTFKEEEVEVKINGMELLLEQNLSFKFTGMTRGDILREILLSAGLNPIINVEGLDNDILDFANEVKRGAGANSNAPIGQSSGNIAQLAQQVCKGKNTALGKAQAIHTYIANHVEYPSSNYSNHRKCPTEVLRSGLSNCCDRARLGHEMANAVGLVNRGVHHPGHVWVQYKINGKWVDSDPSKGSRPSLGSVWKNMTAQDVWTFEQC